MSTKVTLAKRLMSVVLCLALILTHIPMIAQAANYTDSQVEVVVNSNITKIADAPTVNDWHDFFGTDILHTNNAGMVWTDKSVFTSVRDYLEATAEADNNIGLTMDDESNNFLVALSAIAASKSVEGYSTLPTDTILVLDLSGSMSSSNQAVPSMVQAVNDAITKLQALNVNNRVGVIAFSGNEDFGNAETSTAEVILPLGRYTPGLDGNNQSAYLVSSWTTGSGRNQRSQNGVKVANGVTGVIADGVSGTVSSSNAKVVEGGTYIQNGLYKAYQQFDSVTDTKVTDGIQAGTGRVPVMVLLGDGAPSNATTSYTSIGTSDSGNGSTESYGTPGMAFITQLTAAWVREKVEDKYDEDVLFYSLGLGSGVLDSQAAQSVLNPSENTATDSYWSTFLGLKDKTNKNMTVTIRENDNYAETRTIAYSDSVTWDRGEDYITEYFPAANKDAMIEAFGDIVDHIIIQSRYYPTYVAAGESIAEDGFIEFEDYIGKNMEVKSVKGIQLGTTLYDGSLLSQLIYSGGMGTVENPTDAGNNLVWSVQKRLGIETVAEAREVIGLAYRNGQLSYNPATGKFSNYIGWFADADETYVGFWDGTEEAIANAPEGAVYAIKSYGYYSAADKGRSETDMMYATIQVRTTLKDTADASEVGDVRVIGRLPASLIPLVEYDIDLLATDPMDPASMTVTGANTPSRLIYEVGLSDDVDLLDLENTVAEGTPKDADGNYVFYTNQWHTYETDADGNVTGYSYATNKNTISFFSPSVENENYYYNADSQIFVKNGNTYTAYAGITTPSDTDGNAYYHRTIVYTKDAETGEVTAEWYYEPISHHVLTGEAGTDHDHMEKRDDGWYVLRGTIHHYYGTYIMEKEDHETPANGGYTNTLDVSDRPFVHDVSVGVRDGEFHVDSFLGNNGKLTIDPYEGIKLGKTVDDTIDDKTVAYQFTITADNSTFAETVTAIYEAADGIRTEGTVTFSAGKATVSLTHGQSVYLIGTVMKDKTFTVAEVSGEGYGVDSVTVNGAAVTGDTAEVTIAADTIIPVGFVNTAVVTGEVTISKTVVTDYADYEQKEFIFTVTLSGDMLEAGDSFVTLKSDGSAGPAVVPGSNTVILKDGEYIIIQELPAGAVVTAVESDYSGRGFTTAVTPSGGSVTVETGVNKEIDFTNTYDAKTTVPPLNVSVTAKKNVIGLTGTTTWNGSFTFQLQRYDSAADTYVNVGAPVSTAQKTYLESDAAAEISLAALADETFAEAGTYSYRIIEVADDDNALRNIANGIVYDTTPAYFNIVVSDDGKGQLYVSAVTAGTDTVVTEPTENSWSVEASFHNQYRANGAAEAVINIAKSIDDKDDKGVVIPPSGFSFALYETGADYVIPSGAAPVKTSAATGADGKTEIALVYEATGTYYYVLKEVVPANAADGVTYTEASYPIQVVVADTNNKYSVEITADGATASAAATDTNRIAIVSTADLGFTNLYEPDSVTLSPAINGTKEISGKTMKDGAFSFALYETGADFAVAANAEAKQTVSVDVSGDSAANGTFLFGDLTYDRIGAHYYVVKEVVPGGAENNKYEGVTYDTKEYHITVNVTADNENGKLIAAATMTQAGAPSSAIVFRNTYTAADTTAQIKGIKNLGGDIRKLQAGMFQFELVEIVDGNEVAVETVGNGVPANAEGIQAEVIFSEITYTAAGAHTYIVREKLPAGLTRSLEKDGVVYDSSEYEVTVTVTDDGKGALSAVVTYPADGVVFNNVYDVDPTYIDFSGIKTLEGDVLDAGAFEFELYTAKWNEDTKLVEQDAYVTAVTNGADGSFKFDHADITALNFDKIQAYYFIIKEVVPADADPLMDYDLSVYHIEVDVTDNLHGQLVATPVITKVDGDGNSIILSGTSVNTQIDFHNVLNEEPVFVTIGGQKDYNLELTANQFYFDLYQALKDVSGNINAVGDPVLSAGVDADGNFQFEDLKDEVTGEALTSYLTFSKAGTYYFVIKEEVPEGVTTANPTKDGVTYDLNAYAVIVTISEDTDDKGRSILVPAVQIDGVEEGQTLTFENSYDAAAEEGAVISGTKTLTGKTLEDGTFTFALYEAELEDNGVFSYGSTPMDEKTNADGKFIFDEIEYLSLDEAGTHYYVVKEQIPDGVDANNTLAGVTYDDTVYLVEIVVEDHGDGTLTVSDPIYYVLGEDGRIADAAETLEIQNTYEEPKEPPKSDEGTENTPSTGDDNPYILWSAMLVASGMVFLGAAVLGRRKETEKA